MALSVRPQFRQWDRVGHARSTVEAQFGFGQAIGENTIAGFLSAYGGAAVREGMTPQPNREYDPNAPLWTMPNKIPNPFDDLAKISGEIGAAVRGDKPEPTISEQEFKASPDYREAIPYGPGMTKGRQAALSAMYDVNQARAMMSQKEWGGAFIGQFLGQALDPINYIPFTGQATQAAAVARAGGILGRIGVAATDAAISTAVFGAATAEWRRKFGDDISFEAMAQEIGMSMVIGGVFGAGMGLASLAARGLLSIPGRRARDAAMIDAAASRMDGLRDVQGRMAILSDNTSRLARGEDMNPSARIEFERQAAKFQDEIRKQEERDIGRAVEARTAGQRAEIAAAKVELEAIPAETPRAVELSKRVMELEDQVQRVDTVYRAQRELVARGVAFEPDAAARAVELPPAADGTTRLYTATDPAAGQPVTASVEAPPKGDGWYMDVPTEQAAELTARPIEPPAKTGEQQPGVQPMAWQQLPKIEAPPVSPFRRLMINRFMEGGRSGEEGLALAKTFEAAYANLSARAGWTPEKMLQEYPLPEVIYKPDPTPPKIAEPTDTNGGAFYTGPDRAAAADDGAPLASETEMLFAPPRDPNAGDLFQAAPPVDSPAFRAWFGSSKVVDADGKPLVVYHGGRPGTEAFSDRASRSDRPAASLSTHGGIYFTPDRTLANAYGSRGGEVYEVYLSIQNPVRIPSKEFPDITSGFLYRDEIAEMQAAGYDGVISSTGREIVAFSPTQIKSIANRGTFDPNDPRILYQPAYHGSPHIFDRFEWSDKTRGKGEGAQSFGDGLYFAGKKEVAQYYKETLTEDHVGPAKRVLAKADGDVDAAIAATETEIARLAALNLTEASGSSTRDAKMRGRQAELAELTAYRDTGKWRTSGRLYKVDIPHDDELMAWDAPLSEQPPKVREAFNEVAKRAGVTLDDGMTGEQAYRRISGAGAMNMTRKQLNDWYEQEVGYRPDDDAGKELPLAELQDLVGGAMGYRGGDAGASAALRDAGIPGHRFLDQGSRAAGEGTYNYVIYDDSRVNILDYEQEVRDDASTWQRDDGTSTETPRGQISFKDGKSLIKLFDGADPSTALHEAGHHFLMMIKDMGERTDVGPGIKEDWGTVKGWLAVNAKDVATEAGNGVTPDDVLAVLNRNTSGDRMKDIAINRGIHEQWARGFEAYHLEGKAPSVGMRGVFESFRKWLAAIYASVKSLNVNLTPEIRQVFDRLLTDEPTPEIGIVTAPERPAGAPTLDPPPPPPVDPALARAAAAVGKSEDIAGFEEQLGARVDGTYNEEGDIEMLRSLGRILPDEETALKAADDGYKDAVAYEKMLQVALACVIP